MLRRGIVHAQQARARTARGCHRRSRAPGDEGPRRSVPMGLQCARLYGSVVLGS